MSLLLEALKKAEKAKEEAQRRAREGDAAAAPAAPERKAPAAPERRAQPVEMAVEDITVPPVSQPAGESAAPAAPRTAAASAPRPTPRPAAAKVSDEEVAGRASAKNVFEAKFREPNPRMPFYVTMGALGVFAVGTVIYFWYQLRPPSALVNSNPPPSALVAEQPVAPARPAVAAAPQPSAQSSIPGLPTALSSAPAPGARVPAEKPVVETPRLLPRIQPARPAAAPPPEATVVARPPAQVNPHVQAGYSAYMAGDFAAARSEYEQVLREESGSRDALLGLAALDVRGGRYETAEALYMRVLATDPRDPQAQAALVALRSARADPLVTESRVKSMLAADPGAHALNFTLGNQLASQRRWAEAQQEYFKAYVAEPDNPDFAYNLAVSLDHLRQGRQALDYYRRAIALAEKRGASFDLDAAKSRAAQLGP